MVERELQWLLPEWFIFSRRREFSRRSRILTFTGLEHRSEKIAQPAQKIERSSIERHDENEHCTTAIRVEYTVKKRSDDALQLYFIKGSA